MQAELAESLTTHGRALARLENYGMALTALRRAVSLSPKDRLSHSRGRGRICGLSGNGRTVSRNSQKHILRVEPCRNKYMKACQILLVEIETARRKAELNVLEETNEDDGF